MEQKKEVKITLTQQAEQVIREETADFMRDLRQKVRNMLNGALLSLLGLEQRYNNDYEIDHCNSRNSVFIDVLRAQAKEDVLQLIKGIKFPPDKSSQIVSALKLEYDKYYRSALSDSLREIAQKNARIKAQEIAEKAILKLS